jgi:8-oxo-dGTP pyrophosphatase MutT (NUDIX family)
MATEFSSALTVPPHLEQYNTPRATFAASHPDLTDLVVGAFIFSRTNHRQCQSPALEITQPSNTNTSTNLQQGQGPEPEPEPEPEPQGQGPEPRVLLLQRASADSFGDLWDYPGGTCDVEDATLLHGVAREVFEETGYRVSRFVGFVTRNDWVVMKRASGLRRVAKFSFIVEVDGQVDGQVDGPGGWEERVKLAETEHQAYVWATEEEVRDSVERDSTTYRFIGVQGGNVVEAFRRFRELGRGGSESGSGSGS